MNIKRKNLVLIIIATFVFATLLSCGVFALVAKSVSFNMVMHLNPTVYFGLELQVDSNGDGDFSDSFTSNNVAFNESTVYTIFDNRITGFNDHEPWAIVNLNKIVLQNTDALNNPFGDLGVNACFKIKVLNYTSPEMLEVDANSAEMQALWLTLNPTEFSSMYAVPEYGVQNVAYGSYKEFMIYPQSITTDYFEIPFTVELKNKTVDHEIVLVNNTNGSVELGTIQTHVTNGETYKMTFKTPFEVVTLTSVTLGTNSIDYSYENNTLEISGNYISNLTADNDLIITIDLVGDFLLTGKSLNTMMNGGTPLSYANVVNETITAIIIDFNLEKYENIITGATPITANNNAVKDTIKLYIINTEIYILSDYQIFAANCYSMFSSLTKLSYLALENFDTRFSNNFADMFNTCSSISSLDLSIFDTSLSNSFQLMFERCSTLVNLDLSSFVTSNVRSMYGMFNNCGKLASLNISSFDTSNVTNMAYMFSGCYTITNIDVSGFNTAKVTNMHHMFYHCYALTSLNLMSFNTSNVTNMQSMFSYCSALTELNLYNFNTKNVTNMYVMFYNNPKLTTIKVTDNFTTENVIDSGSMFSECPKLVGGNGTAYSSSYIDKTYARIDEGNVKGYFTRI